MKNFYINQSVLRWLLLIADALLAWFFMRQFGILSGLVLTAILNFSVISGWKENTKSLATRIVGIVALLAMSAISLLVFWGIGAFITMICVVNADYTLKIFMGGAIYATLTYVCLLRPRHS